MDTEEEDPSEREPASENWEDKEVILEEQEPEDDVGTSQQVRGWMEDSD